MVNTFDQGLDTGLSSIVPQRSGIIHAFPLLTRLRRWHREVTACALLHLLRCSKGNNRLLDGGIFTLNVSFHLNFLFVFLFQLKFSAANVFTEEWWCAGWCSAAAAALLQGLPHQTVYRYIVGVYTAVHVGSTELRVVKFRRAGIHAHNSLHSTSALPMATVACCP